MIVITIFTLCFIGIIILVSPISRILMESTTDYERLSMGVGAFIFLWIFIMLELLS